MHSINVVDVGHGNCAVIRTEEKCVVIDAAAKVHLLKFLKTNKIDTIDLIILSHSDQDHIAGLQPVLADPEINVKCVVLSADAQKHTNEWRDLRALIDDRVNSDTLELIMGAFSKARNDWAKITQRLALEVISPTTAMAMAGSGLSLPDGTKRLTSNSISIVVRVIFDGNPVALFTGDMDRLALDEIIESKRPASACFLIFPHHGGLPGTSCPTKFTSDILYLVKPNHVIFSNGRGRHSNPRPEIISAVRSFDNSIHVSCTQLSEVCCKESTSTRHYSPIEYSAGATNNNFCLGTLSIDMETMLLDAEAYAAHKAFVSTLQEPMCTRIIAKN